MELLDVFPLTEEDFKIIDDLLEKDFMFEAQEYIINKVKRRGGKK